MNRKVILLTFIVSGMAALIYEIAWIRPLHFIFGSTTYTLATIYSAFMLGLGFGSAIMSRLIKRIKNELFAYSLVEILIGIYGISFLFLLYPLLDIYKIIGAFHNNLSIFYTMNYMLIFAFILIPTLLMGSTWPLLAKAYVKKIGKHVGELYSANNIGAIIGSFAAGFILIPFLGIKNTIAIASLFSLFAASLVLYFVQRKTLIKIAVPVALLFILLFTFSSYDTHALFVKGFYRAWVVPEQRYGMHEILFHKEGLHATIDVHEEEGIVRSLLINGKGQGGTSIRDMRVNYLLAYLPLLLHDNPKNALVIGLGTGTTAGNLARHVKTKVVEIEPAVIDAAKYFNNINKNVLENENVEIVLADIRNYLSYSKEKFDIIVSEPSDPWQEFSAFLWSKEFFEIIAEHLNEEGIYAQWVPIYTMNVRDFRNIYKTFSFVFPYIIAFSNVRKGEWFTSTPSEIILIGSRKPLNVDNIERKFYMLDKESIDDLNYVMFHNVINRAQGETAADRIKSLLLFDYQTIRGYAEDARIITDDNMLLEFSTAMNFLEQKAIDVVGDIKRYVSRVRKSYG